MDLQFKSGDGGLLLHSGGALQGECCCTKNYKISGYSGDAFWGTRATFGGKAADGAAYPSWDGVFYNYDANNWVVVSSYKFNRYFTTVLFPPAAQPAKFTYVTAAQSIVGAGDISAATRIGLGGGGNYRVDINYWGFSGGTFYQVAQYLKFGGADPLGVYNLVAGANPPSPASITIVLA